MAKASDCGSEDRGFESHRPPHKNNTIHRMVLFLWNLVNDGIRKTNRTQSGMCIAAGWTAATPYFCDSKRQTPSSTPRNGTGFERSIAHPCGVCVAAGWTAATPYFCDSKRQTPSSTLYRVSVTDVFFVENPSCTKLQEGYEVFQFIAEISRKPQRNKLQRVSSTPTIFSLV